MTKKDYKAIGQAIREAFAAGVIISQPVTMRDVAEFLAGVFERDNARFDRERFLRFVETRKDVRG